MKPDATNGLEYEDREMKKNNENKKRIETKCKIITKRCLISILRRTTICIKITNLLNRIELRISKEKLKQNSQL